MTCKADTSKAEVTDDMTSGKDDTHLMEKTIIIKLVIVLANKQYFHESISISLCALSYYKDITCYSENSPIQYNTYTDRNVTSTDLFSGPLSLECCCFALSLAEPPLS